MDTNTAQLYAFYKKLTPIVRAQVDLTREWGKSNTQALIERKYQAKDLLQNYANQDYGALVTHKHTKQRIRMENSKIRPDYG